MLAPDADAVFCSPPVARCTYPVELPGAYGETPCGEPYVWETDDLGPFTHLCDAHNAEAMVLNSFRAERVSA